MVNLTDEARQEISQAEERFNRGEYRQAVRELERCLRHFSEEARESRAYGDLLTCLAAALAESGDVGSGIAIQRASLELFERLGDVRCQAVACFNLGNMYKYQNVWRRSDEYYVRATALYSAVPFPRGIAQCRLARAETYLFTLPSISEEELDAVEALGADALDYATILWSFCTLRGKLRLQQASARAEAVQYLRTALSVATESGLGAYLSESEAELAVALAEDDACAQEAGTLLHSAYQRSKAAGDQRWTRYAVLLAQRMEASGSVDAALGLFEQVLQELDLRRSQTLGIAKYLLTERDAYVGLDYARLLTRLGRVDDAFAAAERIQGQTLVDLMFRHHWKRHEGRTISVRSMGRLGLEPPSIEELRAYVAGEALHAIRFLFFGRGQLRGWWLQPSGAIESWDASHASEAIGAVIAALPSSPLLSEPTGDEVMRQPIVITDDDFQLGGSATLASLNAALVELYGRLFPPALRSMLERETGRLLFVPHQDLWSIPFEALGATGSALGGRWDITVAASVGTVMQLDPRRDAELVRTESRPFVTGITAPCSLSLPLLPGLDTSIRLELSALPGAALEAQRVAERLGVPACPEASAGVEAVLRALREANVVHIAAHHVHHPGDATLSFLALGNGERLTFHELGDQVISSAEIIVLSGCQTALGQPSPDSQLGLANAFLVAGARSVLVSLWPISDSRTLAFMDDFYVALKQEATAAAALKRARHLAIQREGVENVLRWGGYRLIGSPSAGMGPRGPRLAGPIFAGGDVLCMLPRFQPGLRLPIETMRELTFPHGSGTFLR